WRVVYRLFVPCALVALRAFFSFVLPTTTAIYTLSLHDALPICRALPRGLLAPTGPGLVQLDQVAVGIVHEDLLELHEAGTCRCRSEEHTSELQSRSDLVCRLLLEKKNKLTQHMPRHRAPLARRP